MKLSIPSLSHILDKGLKTYYRFPFALITAIIGSVAAIWAVSLSSSEQQELAWLIKTMLISGLGISLFVGMDTLAESKAWEITKKYVTRAIITSLLVLYYVLAGDQFTEGPAEFWYRFALFALAAHLFVAFSPFLASGKIDEFWEYNKSLFLRICISALYSAALFIGLVIAMLSIDNLLGIDVNDDRYLQLFIFLTGIFNTWFFLSGVPEFDSEAEIKTIYPKALKVFVQFVLIPLVTVYIGILYLYTGKILVQWELPNGWVSYLVLSFSIVGIFSLLLLYPIRNKENNTWINIYSKGYYLALIPLIGLLLFSIYVRISEYGVTVNRYFVATLGVWLTGIVIYFIVSKTKSIKVIPISLCLIAVVVSFGPLGAFAVSERSQISRLNEVLQQNGMLSSEMKMQKTDSLVNISTGREISSKLDYLIENHGLNSLQVYFVKGMNEVIIDLKSDRIVIESPAQKISRFLGIRYIDEWEQVNNENIITDGFMYTLGNQEAAITIEGYDHNFKQMRFRSDDDTSSFVIGDEKWIINYNFKEETLTIRESTSGKELKASFSEIVIDIRDKHPDKVRSPSTIPPEDLIIEVESDDLKVLFFIDNISGSIGEEVRLSILWIDAYIKIKQ